MRTNRLFSLTIFVILFVFGSFITMREAQRTAAVDLKCLKCHRGKDSLERYVKEKNIKTAEELRNLVRKGPKAGLHMTNTDDDIERAIRYLNLR